MQMQRMWRAAAHLAYDCRCAGFYYFLGYCILSLLALQVMPKPDLSAAQAAGLDATELAASTANTRASGATFAEDSSEQHGGYGAVDTQTNGQQDGNGADIERGGNGSAMSGRGGAEFAALKIEEEKERLDEPSRPATPDALLPLEKKAASQTQRM
jgi:hypothetical protein